MLSGNVLITGGAGFLGRAILRKAKLEAWPARFTVYSRDETKQWELKHAYPDVHCILGDISHDVDRLIAACHGHDTVIHAAAVKYIPEAEHNVFETIDVNIIGSRNVAIAARAAGVSTVVGVSTDKACGPLNVYGMTKGIMERLFSEANRMGSTSFITVRYGNVVGSTGSVIPLFKRQAMEENQIRVTDPNMTRFWLSVDKAVELVELSASLAKDYPGYTLVHPCPSMKIYELAKTVWEMNRHSPPIINIMGIRPGEKLHEALINDQEAPRTEMVGEYFMLRPAIMPAIEPVLLSAYSSDSPNQWLSDKDMISFIKDAEHV
jgi:UDP-N-acetylglucosamine 4,6-dehydratase